MPLYKFPMAAAVQLKMNQCGTSLPITTTMKSTNYWKTPTFDHFHTRRPCLNSFQSFQLKMTTNSNHKNRDYFQKRSYFKFLTHHYQNKVDSSNHGITKKNRQTLMHMIALTVAAGAAGYAAVPLYKLYCSTTGYGGTTQVSDASKSVEIIPDHPLKISFIAQVSKTLDWSFEPVQSSIQVVPGEKVLAFYCVHNHSSDPIVGVATYNVVPDASGIYFHKIQCFCFDEQRVNAHETVHMPVYFYIDPDIIKDKQLHNLHEITLSYTFFQANDQSSSWWEQGE